MPWWNKIWILNWDHIGFFKVLLFIDLCSSFSLFQKTVYTDCTESHATGVYKTEKRVLNE